MIISFTSLSIFPGICMCSYLYTTLFILFDESLWLYTSTSQSNTQQLTTKQLFKVMSMHCNKTYKTIQVAWDWDSCGRSWHGVAGVKMRWMALAKFWQAARWQIGCRKTHSLGHDVAACKQRRTGGRRQKDTLKMSFKSALSQKYACMVAAKKMLVVKENCYGVTFF